MDKLQDLEERVSKIEARNKRVEEDKAWETSFTRKIFLILFTYISIGLYLGVIKVDNPWLNAIVPSVGFLLSTLSLPFFKNYWLKRKNK